MKIMLIGHSCSPVHGSEPGITWNWAWEMANLHEVHLLAHPQHREEVERFLAAHPRPSLHVHWIQLPRWLDPWKPQGKRKWIRVHYLIWQRKLLREALKLNKVNRFDLVHQVGWMTVSVAPLAWKLGIPFIWGPIGGGQTVPKGFFRYTNGSRIGHVARVLRLLALPYFPPLRSAVRHTALVFATNNETERVLIRAGARKVELMMDAGIPRAAIPAVFPERPVHSGLTVLWASRLEPRKALPLALDALARTSNPSIRLLVAGDGPSKPQWELRARHLQLHNRVHFLGQLPWSEMWSVFSHSDLFIFTSLNDTFGSVVAEAMSQGLPILTLAHQGVGCLVPDNAGIKVPVTTPIQTTIDLADALTFLLDRPDARREMGYASWSYAQTITWTRKVEQMSKRYEDLLGEHPTPRPPQLCAKFDDDSQGSVANR